MSADDFRQAYLEALERAAAAGDVGAAVRLRKERLFHKVAGGLALFRMADSNGRLPSPGSDEEGAVRKTTP